jgi:hypothetical protein
MRKKFKPGDHVRTNVEPIERGRIVRITNTLGNGVPISVQMNSGATKDYAQEELEKVSEFERLKETLSE